VEGPLVKKKLGWCYLVSMPAARTRRFERRLRSRQREDSIGFYSSGKAETRPLVEKETGARDRHGRTWGRPIDGEKDAGIHNISNRGGKIKNAAQKKGKYPRWNG